MPVINFDGFNGFASEMKISFAFFSVCTYIRTMENKETNVVRIHDVKIDQEYVQWLGEIKARYRNAQIKAAVKVNAEQPLEDEAVVFVLFQRLRKTRPSWARNANV